MSSLPRKLAFSEPKQKHENKTICSQCLHVFSRQRVSESAHGDENTLRSRLATYIHDSVPTTTRRHLGKREGWNLKDAHHFCVFVCQNQDDLCRKYDFCARFNKGSGQHVKAYEWCFWSYSLLLLVLFIIVPDKHSKDWIRTLKWAFDSGDMYYACTCICMCVYETAREHTHARAKTRVCLRDICAEGDGSTHPPSTSVGGQHKNAIQIIQNISRSTTLAWPTHHPFMLLVYKCDSSLWSTWRISMRTVTYAYVRHESLVRAPWRVWPVQPPPLVHHSLLSHSH